MFLLTLAPLFQARSYLEESRFGLMLLLFRFKEGLSLKTKSFLEERGSALVEVVAFAVVGFGLVLTLGIALLEQERRVLELQAIARNSMRSYLLHNSSDMFQAVSRLQSASKLWGEERINVAITCLPNDCDLPNSIVWLELSADGLTAKAFGVTNG